ncbi:MAG: hypothetical protein M1839_007437 [Geoglossum umbratile]|nr:MAG: hypothetical protein M1839_007437 [Geoglossum umbratile]
MPSSSGANDSSFDSRDEQIPTTEHPTPLWKTPAVSPHGPEYKLFPTVYKPPPPVLRHRPHRHGSDDSNSAELEEAHKDSKSIGKGWGKAIVVANSSNSEDNPLQKPERGGPGWVAKSNPQPSQSGIGEAPDSWWTVQDGPSLVRPELSGPDSAPSPPTAPYSGDLFGGGTTSLTPFPDKGSQFSLPPPPYLSEIDTVRGPPSSQTGVHGNTPQSADTQSLFTPERESHDLFCDITTTHTPHTLPYNTDHRHLNTSSNRDMAGSAVSALSKGAASGRSSGRDANNTPQTPTISRSEFRHRPSGAAAGVNTGNASATASDRNPKHNVSSSASTVGPASVIPGISSASEVLSVATSRDTITSGSPITAVSPASGSRHHPKISMDSRMSPKRSESGSRNSLHTPTRLIGKVRSIFKSGGSGSTYGPSRHSISFESPIEEDPLDSYSSEFEARLMLQTLENSYQQHTLERRRELVEALQYLAGPNAALKGDTLLSEFRRLRLETDSLFLLELEREALEKQKVHELQLNAAAARHDRVRRDAESVRNDFEKQLRMELERRREEEKRELDRIRQAKADQELAERRRHIELARVQAAEELRRAEVEKQRLEEEARVKEAEDSRKIAEEKARAKAEAEGQARLKAEEDKKAENLLSASAAIRGTGFTNVERENNNVDLMQDEYMRLHALLKGFRSWLTKQGKENPALKAKMGELRREIKKTVGQLTAGKNANKEPLSRIINVLNQALNDSESPKIDVRQFVILPNERESDTSVMSQSPDRPALFIYLLNIFAKAVIAQFIDEAGVNPKAAEPVGVIAVTIFANDNFKWRGTPLIDILIAKFRRVCPVLFGIYGKDTTRAGRSRLGWHANDNEWVPEQTHAERMTGLGAGFASVTLRNFSKSKMTNPYTNVKYWQSLQWVCGVPPLEATDTHFIVLKAMIENYASKFIELYGDAAKLALRKALITFPTESGRKSAAVQAAATLADALRRDEMIYLTESELQAEAKAIMAGVSFA